MDNLRGALLMILSMAGFAVEDAFIKAVTSRVPAGQVIVLIGLGCAIGFAIAASRQRACWMTRDFLRPIVLLRNLGDMIGIAALVLAVALVPLAMATALFQATPLLVMLGAILFYGEEVGWRRWVALGLGLFGVLVILRPGLDGFRPEALLALVAASGIAIRDLATRYRPRHIHTLQLSTWGFLSIAPVGAVMLALGDGPVRMTGLESVQALAATLFGGLSYYALMIAVQTGETGFVTPFRYTRLIFAMILAWAIFAERPDALTLVGAAIVVGSGLYMLLRERSVEQRAG